MKKYISIAILVVLGLLFVVLFGGDKKEIETIAVSPFDATYTIENHAILLENGRAEGKIIPGSASKTVTNIFGEPVYGDVNANGKNDAVMFITQETGGSGTFYYVAAALNVADVYHGTNAIFLGDRIAPQNIEIKGEVIMVNYAVRKENEPMSARPSVGVTKYLTINKGVLVETATLGIGEQVFFGNLVMGHEVRTFTPCGEQTYWIMGTSPAYANLKDIYEKEIKETPYTPLYVVLSGRIVPAPTDGFGADYQYGILAKELIKFPSSGSCE